MTHARLWLTLLALSGLVACTSDLAVPTEPLRLLNPEWDLAYVGEAFDGALRPTGGLRPYRFELADGELPPGLTLNAGRLTGVPTEVGRFTFTALVQDGNLSQAVQRIDLDVRELPTPIVRIDAPATEVRGDVPLVVRVEDARGWRGARLEVAWDPDLFELATAPTPADGRIALFHDAAAGSLLLDVAALGAVRQGEFSLARFGLRPLETLQEPARLSLEVSATSRYAGGDHADVRFEGAPPASTTTPLPGAPAPSDPAAPDPSSDPDDTGPIGDVDEDAGEDVGDENVGDENGGDENGGDENGGDEDVGEPAEDDDPDDVEAP